MFEALGLIPNTSSRSHFSYFHTKLTVLYLFLVVETWLKSEFRTSVYKASTPLHDSHHQSILSGYFGTICPGLALNQDPSDLSLPIILANIIGVSHWQETIQRVKASQYLHIKGSSEW
jgi:hypothetical protein